MSALGLIGTTLTPAPLPEGEGKGAVREGLFGCELLGVFA